MNNKQTSRTKRHKRVRAKVCGTSKRPRLSVFRSNQYIYAQLIDDVNQCTIIGLQGGKNKKSSKETKQDAARSIGRELARRAREKNITHAAFDRGGFRYHGRVRALAEGAREEGLVF